MQALDEVRRSTSDAARRETRHAALLLLIGLAASVVCVFLSGEGFSHFDEPAHYLFARWAWKWPAYLLHDWGRPGFTVLHFLPARFGWTACRLLSAALTAAATWFAFRIAQGLGLRPAWAVIPLAFAQPLFFQLSLTTLTETPLALYLSLAVLLALRGRWRLSAAVVSLTFVTRHEAIVFLPVWLFCAWRSRVGLLRLWPIVWAPVAVELISRLSGGHPISDRLVDFVPSTQFGTGSWLTFFARALHAWGPGVTILALLGLPVLACTQRVPLKGATRCLQPMPSPSQALADESPVAPAAENRRSDASGAGGLLVALSIAVYFATHTAIRALGLFASGGYARFLVGISPLVAVAALAGWNVLLSEHWKIRRKAVLGAAAAMLLLWAALERELNLSSIAESVSEYADQVQPAAWTMRIASIGLLACVGIVVMYDGRCHRLRRRPDRSRPGFADPTNSGTAPSTHYLLPGCLALMILLTCAALCRPLTLGPEALIVIDVHHRLRDEGLADGPLVTANLWVDYVSQRSRRPYGPLATDELREAPSGAIFIWDRKFAGATDQNLPLADFLVNPAFGLRFASRPRPWETDPYIYVFEKTGAWPAEPSAPDP